MGEVNTKGHVPMQTIAMVLIFIGYWSNVLLRSKIWFRGYIYHAVEENANDSANARVRLSRSQSGKKTPVRSLHSKLSQEPSGLTLIY